MRPKLYSYTPAATDADGLANDVNSAAGEPLTLAATSAGDNLAHIITMTPSGSVTGNYSLTGTDADGNTQTETVATDTTNAVSSTKYFLTVTEVLAPSGIGAATIDIGWTAVAITKTIPVNWRQSNFEVSLGLDISGTINFTVEHCLDVLDSTAPSTRTWYPHASIASATADSDGSYSSPVTAVRAKVNSLTAGATLAMSVVQGG